MRRLGLAAAALALLGALSLRALSARERYFDTDELEHLHAALLVAHRAVPFRDFFEHHGPLFWAALAPAVAREPSAYAMAEAGRALMSAFWLAMLALAARPRPDADPLEGAAAAVLLSFFGAFAMKSLEIRPDLPAAFLLAAAGVAAASDRRDAGAWTGALCAFGAWFSPKIVFGAAGLAAASLARRPRGERARFAGETAIAALLVAALGLAALAALGALGAFWRECVLFNARFRSGAGAWAFTLEPSLALDGPTWILGLLGLASWRRRPEESGIFAGALAGLFVSPSAYAQYLLFVAPSLCALAATALARAVGEGRGARARGVLAAAVVLAACARPAAAQLALARAGNALQRARWACVERLVPPGARVFDVWSGDAFMRPHAAAIWFFPDDEQANLNEDWVVDGMIAGLRDPRTRAAVRCDSCLARLPARLSREIERDYAPSGCGRLWLRRGAAR